jgi:uncharacterized protein YlaI
MQHICDLCRHRFIDLAMQRVSIYDGEYRIWTPDRAVYFRSHRLKLPILAWLCSQCYIRAQKAQAKEARTGEPAQLHRRQPRIQKT